MNDKPLRLLLDENIGKLTVDFLRSRHFDVVSVLEEYRGASDSDILQLAYTDNRILITLDGDFGQLVFQFAHSHVGVIYLRLHDESVTTINQVILNTLTQFSNQLHGKFIVASETNLRIRT